MSTRSLTTVRSRWSGETKWQSHAHIYRHHDGYLEGHGLWLFDFLKDLKVVNGIGGDMPPRYANGPGRLAAQLVSAMQEDDLSPGLESSDGPMGQEYHYVIDVAFSPLGGNVSITVYDGPMTFFGGGGDQCTNKVFSGSIPEYGEFLYKETCEA